MNDPIIRDKEFNNHPTVICFSRNDSESGFITPPRVARRSEMRILLVMITLSMVGCTDAMWDAQFSSLGEQHDVLCYSGGQEIFKAKTTGKVFSLEGGGWAFRTTDDLFVKTFADCFVSFKK